MKALVSVRFAQSVRFCGLLWMALLYAAALPTATPAHAQTLTPAVINLAKPVGAQQGAYQTITLPAQARMNEIVIYADTSSQDRRIYGLEIRYQAAAGARPSWTPLIGARKGKRFQSFASFSASRPVSKVTLWTRNGGPLAGIQFSGKAGTNGIFSRTFSQKQAVRLGEGLSFGGLVARTDGEQIYALGVIAIDPDNPSSHPAWANNPVLAYTKPQGTAGAQAQDQATLASQLRQTTQQRLAATLDRFVAEVKRGPVERSSGAGRPATTSTQGPSSSVGSQPAQPQDEFGDLPVSFGDLPTSFDQGTGSGGFDDGSAGVGSTDNGSLGEMGAPGQTGSGGMIVGSKPAQPDMAKLGRLVNVEMEPRLGAAAQNGDLWEFEKVSVNGVTEALVRLKNAETGRYLVHGPSGPKLDTPSRFSTTGMWSVEPSTDGNIRLKSRYNGAYLHVAGGVLTASAVRPDNKAARWSLYCDGGQSEKSQKPCGITMASSSNRAQAAPSVTGLNLREVGYRRQLSQRSVQEGKFIQSSGDANLWFWQTGARRDTSRRYQVVRRTKNGVMLKNASRTAATLNAVFEIDLASGRITGRNLNRKQSDPRNFFDARITSRAAK